MPRPMGRPQNKVKYPGKLLMRLINYIFRDYKIHCIAVFILIFVGVIANVQGTMFTRDLIDKYITPFLLSDGTPNFSPLAHAIERVAVFYGIGIVATYAYNRIMINVTQGMMMNMRNELFEHMEKLPIKYFDTHAHGDIMSIYTNDIDTLRQMVSQSIPQIINSGFTIISVFVSMLILNIPLTVVTMIMVAIMIFGTKKAAGQSGKYFLEQQKNLGKVNGYIEEMMNGQKVVKVFCHEEESKAEFKELNEALFVSSRKPYQRLTKAGIQNIFRNIGKKSGVEKVHPHRFRRTAATDLLRAGMPLEEVKEYLGHEKIDTTMIYCTVNQDNIKNSHQRYMSA